MKIKISSKPLPSIKTNILPKQNTSEKNLAPETLDSFPALKVLKKNLTGVHHISKDGNLQSTFIFVNEEGEKGTNTWLNLFLTHAALMVDGAQVDLRSDAHFQQIDRVIQAFQLAHYSVSKYAKGENKKPSLASSKKTIHLIVPSNQLAKAKTILSEELIMTAQQMEAMDLVNGPGNKVNPKYFNSWVRRSAKQCGFKVRILNKKQIVAKGLHGLLAVNRGSEWDPSFIIAEYTGSKRSKTKTLGLIGKGVTFDTGGISIKGSNNLHYMKSDMGGAAAVLATISAVAAMGWPINVVAIAPITDNCVDANAIKPGDVIDSYSGKTIEVINTDAEGRLILADALAYMVKNYDVDHMIDLATLTGSSIRTFGTACAALFSNDDELEEKLFLSGLETREKLWSLPLWDEYHEEMKSDIADIKNLSTRPMAGAITAAKFLQYFTLEHPSWAHLDIAGTAFGDTPFAKGKAATGFGVHLLCHFIKENLLS